jgi:hypothetical protein
MGMMRTVPGALVAGVAGATDLDLGDDHGCVVTGGDVQCWGDGISGELGEEPAGMRRPTPVFTRCFP